MRKLFIIIFVCTALNLSAQTQHVVQRGETLESIAQDYGVTVDQLKKANDKMRVVYVGKRIVIPTQKGKNRNAAAAPVAATNNVSTYDAAATPAVANTPVAASGTPAVSSNAPATNSMQMASPAASAPASIAPNDPAVVNRYQNTGVLGDKERYRRSSLCLIMLTHRGKKYATEMERVFKDFPLPARYNEHNITGLRVIAVNGKQDQKDIDRIVNSNYVAQKVVGRWFNRNDYTGYMDMGLIHDRGGYGAFYSDFQRAMSDVRGTALLKDEGEELLQSTFVLVCDMDYYDQSKTGGFLAGLMTAVQVAAAVAGGVEAAKGNYGNANRYQAASSLASAGAAVAKDIGGFRVKMHAYLYKLKWDNDMTQIMYRDYWADAQTDAAEVANRKAKFDAAKNKFTLEYLGDYKESSTTTILKSWRNEDEVILDVCNRTVNKGMVELAKKFPIFKPRAPFYFEGNNVYSHIGRKEDVIYGKKYEIIQPYKDKKGQINYKQVAKAKAGTPWNNQDIRFDEYFDNGAKGTQFFCDKGSVDLHTPGLQIREL